MIKKRLTQQRKIISHFDSAIAQLKPERIKKYVESLDIADLGDLTKLKEQPSIFTIVPLKVKYEYLSFEPDSNSMWTIFATHVKHIDNIDFELEFDDGVITDNMREYFPPKIIQNISSIIVALANTGQGEVFFTQPQGFWDYIFKVKARLATEMSRDVRSEDATSKKQE
jgi:hypothetical protein